MTDERLGRGLWSAIARLPRGAGIVFRHHDTPLPERRRLFALVRARAAARGIVVVRAGPVAMRGEQGVHDGRAARTLVTASVHDRAEARLAKRKGAHLVFVSPVFATRSHPGAPALGPVRAARLARATPIAAVALGGMDERRMARLNDFHGWAAIDAWAPARQKRKAVPT